jgi:flagellar hook-associated protein 2
MTLRISGLASGIDIDSIVQKLMQANRTKVDKLNQQKQIVEWQREDYRNMNTKIYDYRNNKLSNYRLQGPYLAKKTEITGNTAAVSATALGSASTGSMTVQVGNLATAAANYSSGDIRSNASAFDPSRPLSTQTGNLAGTYTQTTFTINGTDVTFDPAQDSLNSIIDKINKQTNVTAYYDSVSGQVSFMAKQTGKTNGSTGTDANIQFSGDFLTNVLKVSTTSANATAAVNATVTINGMQTERTSNTFEINGVQITLLQQGGGASTINVTTDTDSIVNTIKSFISDYNDMLKSLQDKVSEPRYRDYPPLTDDQKKEMKDNEITLWEDKAKSGLLKNDEILSKAIENMRMDIMTPVETGSTKYKTLTSIGIETGDYSENGKLYLTDETKLRAAIEEDPEAVMNLFAGVGTDAANQADKGIAKKLYDHMQEAMDAITTKNGSPLTDGAYSDESVIGKQLKTLREQIDQENTRLKDLEDRYYRQFTAMETAINNYNAQSAYLANAFGGNP